MPVVGRACSFHFDFNDAVQSLFLVTNSFYESQRVPAPRRGMAILILTMIIVATSAVLLVLSPYSPPKAPVRVAVIDSGLDVESEFVGRVIAQKSFVNRSLGYDGDDLTTTDSRPMGLQHGTLVARIILDGSAQAVVAAAKVVTSQNSATELGIVEAIRWSVSELECEVINLSIGGSPVRGSPIERAIRWASGLGVSVVAAAGNNGFGGRGGSSIEFPATMLEVVTVAGVDEDGLPYDWSGRGPLRNGTAKPDLSALGYYADTSGIAYGTSYAAPRVSSGVVELITHCRSEGWNWTPGMVKAALLAGATHLSSQPYEVGAGRLDISSSIKYIDSCPKRSGLPLVCWMTPSKSPYDFERVFVNSTNTVELSVFSSSNDTWEVFYQGSAEPWIRGPTHIFVNQSASFSVRIHVTSSGRLEDLRADVMIVSEGYPYVRAQFSFDARPFLSKIAFDTSHSSWWFDSIYGQFREFYEIATETGIAVEQLRFPTDITPERLSAYDVVVILDPCSKIGSYENGTSGIYYLGYSQEELAAYDQYWQSGGNLFLVGISAGSTQLDSANSLFSLFNVSLNNDQIPAVRISVNGIDATAVINVVDEHNVTQGVNYFDYLGASLNCSGSAESIAWALVRTLDAEGNVQFVNRTVLAAVESGTGSRLIATGSNYFLDNWGLTGGYHDYTSNAKLARQILLWLIHVP